jgi:hypothetical protein
MAVLGKEEHQSNDFLEGDQFDGQTLALTITVLDKD